MVSIVEHAVMILGILGTAFVFGTDAFSALVLRPAMALVSDATLTATLGNVHRFGDRRMPVPGVIGLLAATIAATLSAVAGRTGMALLAGAAVVLWISWLLLYVRISAPINRRFIAAVDRNDSLPDARELQRGWDRIIWLRSVLLGLAVVFLAIALVL